MTCRISVVIPTYRRRDAVLRALHAFREQTIDPQDFEVILSIDGSDDGTLEAVEGFSAPYGLVALWHPNQGRAGACNAGIAVARGELVVLLDDDMEPSPGFLAGHLAAHAGNDRRAAVGAAPIVVDASSPPLAQHYAAGFNGRQRKLAEPGSKLGFREAYSGNFSIRREVLLEVGGFDPSFRVYGHEDYELALRLDRAGVELVFAPDARADQHYEKDFAALARDSAHRGTTAVVFAMKHPEVLETLPLAQYEATGLRWRYKRAALLMTSRVFPRTPELVVAAIRMLEDRRHPRLRHYYTIALDYFYWLGVAAALREHGLRRADLHAAAATSRNSIAATADAKGSAGIRRRGSLLPHLPGERHG